jgi:general transcription factor IIIA
MLTHGGKRFLCPYKGCGQAFTMNSNLQRHLRGHEQRFPTTTTTSSQVFGGGFPAAAHFSENERVECLEPGCGRLFLSPWGLRGHEFHAHGKRLACPEPGCGKAFRFPSCLQTHQEHVHGKPLPPPHPPLKIRYRFVGS